MSAFAHLLDGFAQRDGGAALAALLHHAVVLARRRDNLLRFEHIVRAGLLDVDILAGLAGPDGLQRVLVVGRGDGDGVDGFVFEQLAEVGVAAGFFLPSFSTCRTPLLQDRFVDVAEGDDLDVGHGGPSFDVVFAAAVETDHGNANGFIRTGSRAQFAPQRPWMRMPLRKCLLFICAPILAVYVIVIMNRFMNILEPRRVAHRPAGLATLQSGGQNDLRDAAAIGPNLLDGHFRELAADVVGVHSNAGQARSAKGPY